MSGVNSVAPISMFRQVGLHTLLERVCLLQPVWKLVDSSLAVDQQHGVKRWIEIFGTIKIAKRACHFQRSYAKAPVEIELRGIFLQRRRIFMHIHIQANDNQILWIAQLLAQFFYLALLKQAVGAPLRDIFDQYNVAGKVIDRK